MRMNEIYGIKFGGPGQNRTAASPLRTGRFTTELQAPATFCINKSEIFNFKF